MPTQGEINDQLDLLNMYRRNLAHEIRRAGRHGGENAAPVDISNGIYEARANVHRIKSWLQQCGVQVEDELNDEPPAESGETPKPTTIGGPSYVFNGPMHIGQANIGGQQTVGEMKVNMGDSFDFSGANISGSNVNVKSKLDNVTQIIGALPQVDPATKQALEQLVAQLRTELQKATEAGHAEEAEKVGNRTDALVTEAGKPKPDKELIEFNAESLKRAAGNIAAVVPAVLTIAMQIIGHIQRLIP